MSVDAFDRRTSPQVDPRPVPSFAAGLRSHVDALAVVAPGGVRLTYQELADQVDAMALRLGAERRLVLLAAANDVGSLVGYLAALRGGHVVLLAARDEPRHLRTLAETYDPDVVLDGTGGVDERRAGTRHALHPEVALLLCTSGSTGSPKLVRLSVANLESNADAIGDYLDIRPSDRAAVSVPMHYCYGLSVIHSNLLRGAAVLLSDLSVTDPGFWSMFRANGGTSLHGVPYTFELLDGVGFDRMELPALRYVTQAGGRLDPAAVRRYAELGAGRGWRFVVMYGQTEATARMAYLPPELAVTGPSAIGVPIPGGAFEIEPTDDAAGPDEGELVYRGPNVMLGYATGPADLARGRTVHALRTGDLARRRPDGLYEVIGRRHRFIKPFGLRIDLGQVERLLADEGATAVCSGSDTELVVALRTGPDPDAVQGLVAGRLRFPAAHIRVVVVEEFPRLGNGKIDQGALAGMCRPRRRRPAPGRPRSVPEAFRAVFPIQDLPAGATFVTLGGDSLSYVRMTVELQRVLGHLPQGWHTTSIERLTQLPPRRRAWPTMETGIVLRAVAIVLVVGSHANLFHVLGGAHLLLGIAGWTFARFVLADGRAGVAAPSRRILRSAARIAVPTAVWIGWRAAVQGDIELGNSLLINYFLDPAAWGYWYVETLSQSLLLLAVLFAIPAVRRFERAQPFRTAVIVLGCTLVGRAFPDTGNEFSDRLMSTHLVLWLFVLGWVVHRATTPGRRVATAVLVTVLVPTFFVEVPRGSVVLAGLLLLLLVPRIAVPRAMIRPIAAVASASLAMYLTHYAVIGALPGWPPVVLVAVSVAVGIAVWTAVPVALRAGRAILAGPAVSARVWRCGVR